MIRILAELNASLLAPALILGVYLALVAAAQILRRTRGVRFRWIYHLFALAAGVLAAVHYAWRDFSGHDALLPHLVALTALLAVFPLASLINHFLWSRPRHEPSQIRTPRLLSDATSLVLFVTVFLLVLQFIYGQHVPGLLAGSGVAAIILGLAMQDLLANTIAGIALFVEKPFKTGDWLKIGGEEARVVEVTWRSVRLLTDDDVFLDVPNTKVVQEPIVNFHLPDSKHSIKTTIGLHYDVPPARAIEVLRKAAASAPNVCPNPLPSVWLKELGDNAVIYEIEVWLDDHGRHKQVLSDVRSNCWYAARRAGMEIPYPQLTIHQAQPIDASGSARATAAAALRAHAILGVLPADQIEELVRHSPVVLFSASERIIEQGTPGDSMFLLVKGSVEVRIAREGRVNVVATLGSRDCLGEMSLLTGDARNATVVATTEVEAVEIRKDAFAAIIRAHPEAIGRLGELLAQRQLANEKIPAGGANNAHAEEVRASVLRKLRSFFQLGA